MKRMLLTLVLLMSLLLFTSPVMAQESYPPTEDAHTDMTEPTYNTGSEFYSQLAVSNLAGCIATTQLWLKFSIPSDLPTVTNATLTLLIESSPPSVGTTNLQLRYSDNTTWDEGSITWGTQPSLNDTVLGIAQGVVGGTTATFSSAALATLANTHKGQTISLVVKGECGGTVSPVVALVARTKEHTSGSGALLTLDAPTAVTLANFGASSQNNQVRVEWETATELDNLGFNLYRGESATGPWAKLNTTIIPAQQPGLVTGAVYEWLDEAVPPDTTVFYRLEDVDIRGVSTFHGPVSAFNSGATAVKIIAVKPQSSSLPVALLLLCSATLLVWPLLRRQER